MTADPAFEEALEARLRTIAVEVLGPAARTLPREADLRATLGVDSLTGLRYLAAIETALPVRFPDERLGSFRSLASILDFLSTDSACRNALDEGSDLP